MNQDELERELYKNQRHTGVVNKWFGEKGFGFIRSNMDGQSYFVHRSQLTEDFELVRGSIVEFEVWTDRNDPDKKFAARVLVCELPEEKPRQSNKRMYNRDRDLERYRY